MEIRQVSLWMPLNDNPEIGGKRFEANEFF
jgi:hypothetical protein